MQSLCYPYGSGITCVCDRGEIFKCFPDLKSDSLPGGGALHPKQGSGVMVGAKTQLADNNKMEDTFDRSTEVVLASTFLILVILIFIAIFSVEPQLWSLQQSYTMPLLANGHTKSGILPASLYNSGHGTLPRGRLEHVAATCSRYELRQAAEMEVDCVKSYDHLLAGGMLETDTQGVIDSTSGSGVQQSEAEDVSETDVLVPTFSPSVTMDKY